MAAQLHFKAQLARDGFRIEAAFDVGAGITALFGRSGAGKSSIIDLIAGLVRPDQGHITIGEHVLVDTDKGIFVPPHKRRIGYVFQDGRLFPHLDVKGNLAYGRWFSGRPDSKTEYAEVVALLGLGPLLDRRVGNLSGGEKQRVAIGRALLSQPRLLLMDEPLAALDNERKAELLPFIERLRDESGIPIIYVSHAVPEVVRLANDLVMIEQGRVLAYGPLEQVFGRFELAAATGAAQTGTVLNARVARHDENFGLTILQTPIGDLTVPRLSLAADASLRIQLRAGDVMLALQHPSGISALNVIAGEVASLGNESGAATDVTIKAHGHELRARITRKSAEALGLRPGLGVHAIIKSIALEGRDGS